MKRREFLKSGSTAALAPFPLQSGGIGYLSRDSDVFAPLVTSSVGIMSFDPPEGVRLTGGDNNPEWIVWYSTSDDGTDKRDSLKAWVDASDSRTVISENTDRGWMVIRADDGDVGPTFVDRILNRGLHAQSYVERIDLSVNVARPEPPRNLETADEFSPGFTRLESARASLNNYDPTGLAFEDDAEVTPMDDVLTYIDG